MMPKHFYPIARNQEEEDKYFLFGKRSISDSQDKKMAKRNRKPEEEVRQWAIYVLLSEYGIRINSIEIEKAARDHSTKYPADIVVNRNDKPYIVVECKRPYGNNPQKVLKQAQIYADDLMAEFAIYTDGPENWKVTRKIGDSWIPVDDIPRNADTSTDSTITDTLEFIEQLKPLLFWLYRTVPSLYAHEFLSIMQKFFAGFIVGLEGYDDNLKMGTVLLLELLAGGLSEDGSQYQITSYEEKKMFGASKRFYTYFIDTGLESFVNDLEFIESMKFTELFSALWEGFDDLVKKHTGMAFGNVNLIRFVFALLQYMNQLSLAHGKTEYDKDIPASLSNCS